jgi:Transglycosylase SLT domain
MIRNLDAKLDTRPDLGIEPVIHYYLQAQRAHQAILAMQRGSISADPNDRPSIEIRDADPEAPNPAWRSAALGFVAATVVCCSAGIAALHGVSSDDALNLDAQLEQAQGPDEPLESAQSGQSASGVVEKSKTFIVVVNGQEIESLIPEERIRLCKEVAKEARLKSSGLDWRDLYAVVHAESGWAPRDGMGFNGKISRGIAQIEDATAKSLGVDANDPKQSLEAVASLLKSAQRWSHARGHSLKDASLSVYYNLSTKGREMWDGVTTDDLPIPTQHHIANVKQGKLIATRIDKQLDVQRGRESLKESLRESKSPNASIIKASHSAQQQGAPAASLDVAGAGIRPASKVTESVAYSRLRNALIKTVGSSFESPLATDASGQPQKLKGLITEYRDAKPHMPDSETAEGARRLQSARNEFDQSGLRMSVLGLDEFRSSIKQMVSVAKLQSAGARAQLSSPGAENREAQHAVKSFPYLSRLLGAEAVLNVEKAFSQGQFERQAKADIARDVRREVVLELAKQENLSTSEVDGLAKRNPAFAALAQQMTQERETFVLSQGSNERSHARMTA